MSPAPEESSRSRLVVAHITGDQFVHNDIYYHTSTRLVGALSSRRREGGRVSHTPSTLRRAALKSAHLSARGGKESSCFPPLAHITGEHSVHNDIYYHTKLGQPRGQLGKLLSLIFDDGTGIRGELLDDRQRTIAQRPSHIHLRVYWDDPCSDRPISLENFALVRQTRA